MALIKAKCTECGAPLQVNDGSKKARCPHCGNVFIVEDAVNNYNYTYNTTNNIKTDVVNIINPKDEFIIESGVLIRYVGESDVVVVPDNVKVIGGRQNENEREGSLIGAFQGTGVKEVTLPSSVIEIEHNAFRNCRFLQKLHINGPLEHVGMTAFSGCPKLEELDLEVENLENAALAGLTVKTLRLKTDSLFVESNMDEPDLFEIEAKDIYLSVKDLDFIPQVGGNLHIDNNIEYIFNFETNNLYVEDVDKFIAAVEKGNNGQCMFKDIFLENGEPVKVLNINTVVTESYNKLFPLLKDKEVHVKKLKGLCPICGSKLGMFAGKCKECGCVLKKK